MRFLWIIFFAGAAYGQGRGVVPRVGAVPGVGVVTDVEQEVPATVVREVGGFAGDRIARNEEGFLKTFPIGNYVSMVEKRDFTGWDWRQGEQPGKWLESSILTATRTHD